MEYKDVFGKIQSKKRGCFSVIEYTKKIPVSKEYKGNIVVTKKSRAIVRFGVVYDNIANVVQKRAAGILPSQNAGLPWGQWKVPGYFIEHLGNIYLRCSLVNGNPVQEQYYVNGNPVSQYEAEMFCPKSSFRDKSNTDVLTINIENIKHIE